MAGEENEEKGEFSPKSFERFLGPIGAIAVWKVGMLNQYFEMHAERERSRKLTTCAITKQKK